MAQLPLEGIRVISQGISWAGPYAGMILGDMGAEVIELESIQKLNITRAAVRFPPASMYQTATGASYPNREGGPRHWDRNANWLYCERGHKAITINQLSPKGRELLLRLVKVSDVIFENNAAGVWEKMGLTWDVLREVNPGIIYLSMPGYGSTGPYKRFKALGANIEAYMGHTLLRGYEDMDPSRVSAIYHGDPTSGTTVVFIMLAALNYRNQTGKGQFIDMSQVETTMHSFSHAWMDYSMNRRSITAWGNRSPSMAPHNAYPCAGDDNWIAIACQTDDEFQALCQAMGKPQLVADEQFADVVSRYHNQKALDSIISDWTKDKDNRQLMFQLQGAGVTAGVVSKQSDMMSQDPGRADPQLTARNYFEPVTHPIGGPMVNGEYTPGTHRIAGPLAKFSKTPMHIKEPSPMLGQHNEYVFKELLGISDQEYQQLWDEQIIGDTYLDNAT